MAEPTTMEIESGLEVRENTDNLPQHYAPESYKEAVQHTTGPLLSGDGEGANEYEPRGIYLSENERNQRRRYVCGMGPVLFGSVVAAINAILVGAVVGGGLGAALADASSHSTTVTITTTVSVSVSASASSPATTTGGKLVNYTVPAATAVYSVALDCPNVDGNTYTTQNGQAWAVSCKRDEYTGDLGAVLAYTYQDCIEACAALNTWQHVNYCSRVQFSALLANMTENGYGNCWLKNTSAYTIAASTGDLSAKLISD